MVNISKLGSGLMDGLNKGLSIGVCWVGRDLNCYVLCGDPCDMLTKLFSCLSCFGGATMAAGAL